MTTSPEEHIAEYLLESTESESASETDEDYFEIEESSDLKRYLHQNQLCVYYNYVHVMFSALVLFFPYIKAGSL